MGVSVAVFSRQCIVYTMQGQDFENNDTIIVVDEESSQSQELIMRTISQPTMLLTKRGLPMRQSARGVASRVNNILQWEQASDNSKLVKDVAILFENEFQHEADNKKRRITQQTPTSDSEVELGDTDDDDDQSSIIDSGSDDDDFTEPSRETESESDIDGENSSSDRESERFCSQTEITELLSEISENTTEPQADIAESSTNTEESDNEYPEMLRQNFLCIDSLIATESVTFDEINSLPNYSEQLEIDNFFVENN